jgi:hypothetical protein
VVLAQKEPHSQGKLPKANKRDAGASSECSWASGPPEDIKIIRVARRRGTPWRAPTIAGDG